MKNDIASREDIDALMVRFYGRAMSDPLIGPLFTDVARLDLEHHLPVIGDFWESTLFGSGVYSRHRRNPLLVHAELDRKARLEPRHFARWLELGAWMPLCRVHTVLYSPSFISVVVVVGMIHLLFSPRSGIVNSAIETFGGQPVFFMGSPDWFRPLYDFHSFKVLPRLGKLFAGDADSYQYLAESIRKHPPQDELKAMMGAAGFARAGYRNLSGGIVAIHTGYKA